VACDNLQQAAFSGGLANSLLPDPAALGSLSADALRAYVAQQFVGSNMAVAGAGISLAALQQVAEPLLAAAGSGAAPAAPASSYTGGVLVALSPGAEPTVGVAFQAKGGLGDLKATATATVAKALLAAPVREVLPWQGKALEGPLTSVTPVVQVCGWVVGHDGHAGGHAHTRPTVALLANSRHTDCAGSLSWDSVAARPWLWAETEPLAQASTRGTS
jgi:hypothetical protein